MECKKCSASVAENAAYCYNCGSRVDGKKPCPACGKVNEEGYKYCIYCGARTDGKTVCGACGAEHEGAFCPQCGNQSVKAPAVRKKKEKTETSEKTGLYGKIMNIISKSGVIFAAWAAVVFMFFIGFDEISDIFYYFKDTFKEAKDTKAMLDGAYFTDSVNALTYTYAVVSLLIAVATLACTLTFFIIAMIRFVGELCGKQVKSPVKPALFATVSYILGASLLYTFEQGNLSGVKVSFNTATIVGLTLCAIGLAIAAVCKLLENFEDFKRAYFIKTLVCTAVCVIFATVAFLLARNAGLKIKFEYASFRGGPAIVAATMIALFGSMYASDGKYLKTELDLMSAMGIVGQLLVMAAVVFLMFAIVRNIRNHAEKEYKSGLLWAILSAAFAVASLICAIVLGNHIGKLFSWSDVLIDTTVSCNINYIRSILLVLFAALNLGVTIASKIVCKKKEAREYEIAEIPEN